MPVPSQSFIYTLVIKNFDFVINRKSTSVDHLVKNSFSWQLCECWSVSCVCAQLNRKTFVVHQQKLHAAGSPPLQNNFATATTLTWTFKLRRAPELTYTGVGWGAKIGAGVVWFLSIIHCKILIWQNAFWVTTKLYACKNIVLVKCLVSGLF